MEIPLPSEKYIVVVPPLIIHGSLPLIKIFTHKIKFLPKNRKLEN